MRSNIQSNNLAQQVMLSLHKLAATIETGILDPYPLLLVEATAHLNRFITSDACDYPEFATLAQSILNDYQYALEILQNTAQSGTRMSGGGFGLEGFIIGAAISTGVNTLLDSSDVKKANAAVASASRYWEHAASQITLLEYFMQNGVLPPKKTLKVGNSKRVRSTLNTSNSLVSDHDPSLKPTRKTKWGCLISLVLVAVIGLSIQLFVPTDTMRSIAQSTKTTQHAASPSKQHQAQQRDVNATLDKLPLFIPPEEPDWDVRKRSLELEYDRKTPKPDLSKEIAITLKTGSTYKGMVVERYEYSIIFKNAKINMTFDKNMLDDKTQKLIWPGPAKATVVAERLRAEKESYLVNVQQAKTRSRDNLIQAYDDKLLELKKEISRCQSEITGMARTVSGRILQVVGLAGQDVLFVSEESTEPIYIDGLGGNHVDGDHWNGIIYFSGTTSYIDLLGASRKVRRYNLIPPKELAALIKKNNRLTKEIAEIQSQKETKRSAFGVEN